MCLDIKQEIKTEEGIHIKQESVELEQCADTGQWYNLEKLGNFFNLFS